jgi:hypothetical protein
MTDVSAERSAAMKVSFEACQRTLVNNDGTFALEAPTFKKYFAGFGLVK